MQWIIVVISLFLVDFSAQHTHVAPNHTEAYMNDVYKASILKKVNRVRSTGCFCDRKYMPSTTPLTWNDTLYKSALVHAKEMTRYNFFAHYSIEGADIGERLEEYGYDWQVAGENLGEGQRSFEEVLRDWLNSRSHCKMLMNPKVNEMAVATQGRFWVQHFGKQMPANSKKVGRKYTH